MSRLQNCFNYVAKTLKFTKMYTQFPSVMRMWSGTASNGISEANLKDILQKKFPSAKSIEVTDVSGGCGAMFDIFVESPEFKGLSVVKQHKTVTNMLKEEIKQMHGLRIETKVSS